MNTPRARRALSLLLALAAMSQASATAAPNGEAWSRSGVMSRFATVYVYLANDGPMPGSATITLSQGIAAGVGPLGSQPMLDAVALVCPWAQVDCELRALQVERLTSDGASLELDATWGDGTPIEVTWETVGERFFYTTARTVSSRGETETSQDVTLVGSDGEQYSSGATVTGSWGGSPMEALDETALFGHDVVGSVALKWSSQLPGQSATHAHRSSLHVTSLSANEA